MKDNLLLEQLKLGNAVAFEKIYNRFYAYVFVVAINYVNEETAKDIRSISFIKLWELRDRLHFDTIIQLKNWLAIIAKNNCLDYVRAQDIHANKEDEVAYYQEHCIIDNEKFELIDKEAAIIERLYNGIRALPKKNKEVFEFRWLHDLKFTEISNILKQDVSTVKKRYARAVILLKRFLYGK